MKILKRKTNTYKNLLARGKREKKIRQKDTKSKNSLHLLTSEREHMGQSIILLIMT